MINFTIEKPDTQLAATLQDKMDNLSKLKGSLGTFEHLASKISLIQQTC